MVERYWLRRASLWNDVLLCVTWVTAVSGLPRGCTSSLTGCCSGCQGDRWREWPHRQNSQRLLLCCYTHRPRSSAWPNNICGSSTAAGKMTWRTDGRTRTSCSCASYTAQFTWQSDAIHVSAHKITDKHCLLCCTQFSVQTASVFLSVFQHTAVWCVSVGWWLDCNSVVRCSTLSPVSTGMGDCLQVGIPPWYVTKPAR